MAAAPAEALGTGETMIAGNAGMAQEIKRAAPGATVPEYWRAADPMATLRAEGASARIALTFGHLPFTAEMMDALPALRCILAFGAGYEGVDVAAARARGVMIANAGEANCADVADHAVALALAVRRDIVRGHEWVRDGRWERDGRMPMTHGFSGSRAGIVGLGHIGREIARRLRAFDCDVAWWGPREKPDASVRRAPSLIDLARNSDLLFIACPGGPETHRLIDRAVIDAVGPDGLLVTVARGSVIDEDALIAALEEGRLGGAGLDVFEVEPTPAARWRDVPNTVLAPHAAGATLQSMRRMRDTLRDNIRRLLDGEPLLNRQV